MTADLDLLARAAWLESEHPRGKGGRFVHGVGAGQAGQDWGEDFAALPTDRWIPDLAPAKGVKDLTSRGRPDGAGTADDPIDVQGNLTRALSLMRRGKHVRLNQPDEVALLLDKVVALSRRAERKGQRPTWDFGLLSVTGTNLFTAQHRGIPRMGMPQFSGVAQSGSEAARLAGGAGKFIDLGPEFAARLRREGVAVRRKRVLVSHLRATQTELDGAKVAGFADAVRHGNPKAEKALAEPIFVTRDHYVIDGHHRWAGNLMLDALDGKLGNDTWQNVTEIDMDIGAAIPYALAFAQDMGIANRALGQRSLGLAWDGVDLALLPHGLDPRIVLTSDGLSRAAAAGHHVPGTGYDWRHDWDPLTVSAAKSHYHGRIPHDWAPGHPHRVSVGGAGGGRAGEQRAVREAAGQAREALAKAEGTRNQYGAPKVSEQATQRTREALAALEAEAAKPNPDPQVLGKRMQDVYDGASLYGSSLQFDPAFAPAVDKLRDAVIAHQTEIAMRGVNPKARHLTVTSKLGEGGPLHLDIRDESTLRQVAHNAALKGLVLTETGKPPDLSGLPPNLRRLYEHSVAHGWNTQLATGNDSSGAPSYTVTAFHPEKNLRAEQTYIGGKRFTYSAEPLKAGMERIAANPRTDVMLSPADKEMTDTAIAHARERALADRERSAHGGGAPARPATLKPGERRILASGTHQGVTWQHYERKDRGGIGTIKGYRLEYQGHALDTMPRGTPEEAAAKFKAEVDAIPGKQAAAEQRQRERIGESARIMLGKDRQHQILNPLGPTEVTTAYKTGHGGRNPPVADYRRWNQSGVTEAEHKSAWYQEALAKAKREHRLPPGATGPGELDARLREGHRPATARLPVIAPKSGRDYGKSFLRVGHAESPKPRSNGEIPQFGIYGVRDTPNGQELYVQFEGTRKGNVLTGVPIVVSDTDSEPYFWLPAKELRGTRIFEANQPASRAAVAGHHVPGTDYDWEHGYVPETWSAAESHFHGRPPGSWRPGQVSGHDPRKGTKLIAVVSKNSRHPRTRVLWRVTDADARKIVNDPRTSLTHSALFAYSNDQLPPEKMDTGRGPGGSGHTWEFMPDNGMWDDLLKEHRVTKIEHHGNLLPMPGEARYHKGQGIPPEFAQAAGKVAHDAAGSPGPDEVLAMTPPYQGEAVSEWEKRARQDWGALEYAGAVSRSGHWKHEWVPLDIAAAQEKFHHRVPLRL